MIINMVGGGGDGAVTVAGAFNKGSVTKGQTISCTASNTMYLYVSSVVTATSFKFDRVYARGPNGDALTYTPNIVVLQKESGNIVTSNAGLFSYTKAVTQYSNMRIYAGTHRFKYTSDYATSTAPPSIFPVGTWEGKAYVIPFTNNPNGADVTETNESILVDITLVCDGTDITGSFTLSENATFRRYSSGDSSGVGSSILGYAIYPIWLVES